MDKKGFTFIELLAVMVILGILFTIASTAVSGYIHSSRVELLVDDALSSQQMVSQDIVLERFQAPVDYNDVTIVSASLLNKEQGGVHSPFGSNYVENKSYVAVVNVGTANRPRYRYYVAVQDEDRNALPLTESTKLDSSFFIRNAKNRMELTIQSFCGTEEGIRRSLYTIKGLEEIQQTDSYGYYVNWDALIYSSDQCGRSA